MPLDEGMSAMLKKRCSRCSASKLLIEFNKKVRSKDGHRPECRTCQRRDSQAHKPIRQVRDAQNKEKLSLYNAQYHEQHREAILARHVRNRANNPEKHVAYSAAYRAMHPEYFREAAKRRRALEKGAHIVDLSQEQFKEMLERSNYRCCYCADDCVQCRRKTHKFQKEHLTPLVRSGNHTVHNVLPACPECNAKKHAGKVLRPVQPFLLTAAPPHIPRKLRQQR
jgi:hypothetical protein